MIVAPFLAAIAGCATAPAALPTVPKTVANTAAVTTSAQATENAARALGLKPRNRNGAIVYCRSGAEVGTRFETATCYSKEELPAVLQRSLGNQETVEEMRKRALAEHAAN